MSPVISPELLDHIRSNATVTSALARSAPDTSVKSVADHLFGSQHAGSPSDAGAATKILEKLHLRKTDEEERVGGMQPLAAEQVEEVLAYGKWGQQRPSDLFLNIFAQALLPLHPHPLNGLVSPSLMGACGVIPLSIVSVIPDIIKHHADLIVRAEREIFLATNYWEASSAAKVIVDALRELSRRVVESKREKVVVKLMYDRGNPEQVVHAHQPVDAKTYTGPKVNIPHPDELPGIILEVQNYHEPPVGTFHAKYMVVDRRVGVLNSNNIQDRVNVEMMTHLEGPIVQSMYDMALLSWSNAMNPPLPLLSHPPTYAEAQYSFGKGHPIIAAKGDLGASAQQARDTLQDHHTGTEVWDDDNQAEADRADNGFSGERAISRHLNTGTKIDATDTDHPRNAAAFKPVVLHSPHEPVPMALVNRPPRGRPGHGDTFVPQDQAWLAAFKFASRNVFIQTPTFNAKPVVAAALEACRRGILVEIYADLGFNDEGELLPFQGGTNQMVVQDMYSKLEGPARKNLRWYWYTGKDQRLPLNAKDKSRNCHVKIMIVDGHIGIQGNGNQDTQSWYHSQEINVLLDSELICKEWRDAIDANQNTLFYGQVSQDDGIWRDERGQQLAEGERGKVPKGPMKSLVGVKGAIQRVRGEGGF